MTTFKDDNLIRGLLANSLIAAKPSPKRSLDLHYESGNFKKSYPVPAYLEIMAKIKPKFISFGDRRLIERQRAITAHYAQLDIQELNRQCLKERKARYLDPADPFK
jgi:hypothetical protein